MRERFVGQSPPKADPQSGLLARTSKACPCHPVTAQCWGSGGHPGVGVARTSYACPCGSIENQQSLSTWTQQATVMQTDSARYRKLRKSWNEAGHAHSLTFCCFHRLPLLSADRTRLWLLDALDRARDRWHFELWAYVIMPEHVHLLVCPQDADYRISHILKAVKQPVARSAIRFLREQRSPYLRNLEVRRNGKVEHRFWQEGGGYDRNIHDERTAWTNVEYIHANPVRRGLAECPTDWAWSSARSYAGLDSVRIEPDAAPPSPALTRTDRRRHG